MSKNINNLVFVFEGSLIQTKIEQFARVMHVKSR